MLGQARLFNEQTNDNKKLNCPIVAVEAENEDQWIITGWEGCTNPWGNAIVPAFIQTPNFRIVRPGETVSLDGILWFYEGTEIEAALEKIAQEIKW